MTNTFPSRKDFLRAIAGSAVLSKALRGQAASGKLLIVVAHPDDEYAFAAATYRLIRESGWVADQVTITDGESGYRYSTLAETFYGVRFAQNGAGRTHLAAIRKEEVQHAGKILGIRQHHFLNQRDLGFDTRAAAADSGNWDRPMIRRFLSGLLARERYDAVFTLLPTAETHGHHRAATLLALEAVSTLTDERRPLIFGVEPRSKSEQPITFAGLAEQPLFRTVESKPSIVFDRGSSFGYRSALNYQIVVNWVIAEHKSQGMFQNDYGKHEFEEFWLFAASGKGADSGLNRLRRLFNVDVQRAVAH